MKIATQENNPLESIAKDLIPMELKRFKEALEQALEPQKDYLTDSERALYAAGKKLRPMVLLLTARLFQDQGDLPQKVVRASASLEMLHVATLIHDDIVDHAEMRRGVSSVNAARGTEMAVLVGDLQFLQAIRCFFDSIEDQTDMNLVKLVRDTAFDICCGEIDEMKTQAAWSPKMLHSKYITTIDRKTSILFALSCEAAASLMRARTSDIRRMGIFGRHMGRAFQMMDDIFDLAHSPEDAGKRKGLDLHRRRLTLPIIHAMALFGDDHPMVLYLRGEEADEAQINHWVDEIRCSDAFGLAYEEARQTALHAVQFLDPFEDSPYKQALLDITMCVVNRGY
jgi:heptaprenyl diphosphate synthase